MRRIPLRMAAILFGGLFLAGCPYGERRPITESNTEIPRPAASETPIRSIDFNIENIPLGDNEKRSWKFSANLKVDERLLSTIAE